jgi:signal transduction histidine kinase
VQAGEEDLWRAARSDAHGRSAAAIVRPRQRWSLNFVHPGLERLFGQVEYTQNRRFITVACSVMAAVVACFFALDPILAPAYALDTIAAARAWVGLPSLVMLVVGVRLWPRSAVWVPWAATFGLLYMLVQAVLLLKLGVDAFQYLSYGVWQGLIAIFFLMGLPFRWAMVIGACSCLAYGGAALLIHVGLDAFMTYFAVDAVIVYSFCAIAVFRYERASRRQFVAQAQANFAYDQQLLAQADRRRWLEVFADFLGHELKNAMARLSSAIDLASLKGQEDRAQAHRDSAQQSLAFMRRLLTQAADATSLEAALTRSDRKRVPLSDLVVERMAGHQQDSPEVCFDLAIEPAIVLEGNEDALVQLLDKLVNNAIEHGSPGLPVQVQLRRLAQAGWCRLAVRDLGDPLPTDTQRLFEPFYTDKGNKAALGASNLGLGLFVAETIARHHGGHLSAEPILDRESGVEGAVFWVDLPLVRVDQLPEAGTQR